MGNEPKNESPGAENLLTFEQVFAEEIKKIQLRRNSVAELAAVDIKETTLKTNLSGICLSGGGIRSACFSMGVVQALQSRKLFRAFDYLSTVSGGGYLARSCPRGLSETRRKPHQVQIRSRKKMYTQTQAGVCEI